MSGTEPRGPPPAPRVAADGSPLPDRASPTFERDVQAMFTHIVRRYDWFDHAASLGNDYLWRPRALWDLSRFRARQAPVRRVLDIGCGTGDLTRLAARYFPSARIVGADFTSAMLQIADRRTRPESTAPRVGYLRANARRLPVPPASFDVIMSAFVVRNLVDLPGVFREFRRVVRSPGTILTLEITEPAAPLIAGLFHAYFDHVVPWLGAAVHSAGPYRYLPDSLRGLPRRSEMVRLLHEAGFPRVEAHAQSMGIVTAYLAGTE
ncbi:MAG: ubiquinone/menaquinone biosynthesis methyltransferase [Thermoplasmata archaeon]|nr:ubiquinone/menaquinone biosynthesis methyltransferase [Thermoplasmata archaeon]